MLKDNILYVSMSKIPGANRGVFAGKKFTKDDVIEICPFIELPEQEIENLENSVLTNYIFFFGMKKERMLLCLGFGSLYNHSYSPNAKYKILDKEKVVKFSAIKDIKKGEEITFNYLQGNKTKLPLWFEKAS